jgi:hypothetical protein
MPYSTQLFAFPEVEPLFYTNLSLREYKRPGPGKPLSKTLKTYIRLPIPSSLQDSYGIEVSAPSFATFNAIADVAGAAFGEQSSLLAAGKSKLEQIGASINSGTMTKSKIVELVSQAVALAPGSSDLQKYAQATTGVVRNPHVTTIFDGVKLKSFEFTWRLSPRSEAEAQKMNQMVNYIKGYMHPAILNGSAGFALDYPYIATINFSGLPAEVTPFVNDSFITGMAINSTAGGAAFFRDGQPVTTDLTLTFQEINIRTREDFGYSSNSKLDPSLNMSAAQAAGVGGTHA